MAMMPAATVFNSIDIAQSFPFLVSLHIKCSRFDAFQSSRGEAIVSAISLAAGGTGLGFRGGLFRVLRRSLLGTGRISFRHHAYAQSAHCRARRHREE